MFAEGGWENVITRLGRPEPLLYAIAGFLLVGDERSATATAEALCAPEIDDAIEASGLAAFGRHKSSSSFLRAVFMTQILHGDVTIEEAFDEAGRFKLSTEVIQWLASDVYEKVDIEGV